MRRLLIPLALTAATPAAAERFDPLTFFVGRTEGTGAFKIILRRTHHVRVHGRGVLQGDGSIVLDQTIEDGAKKPQKREWHIRQVAPGRYTGTLSEARGPIMGESIGDAFHLKYRTKSGTAIEQWITLAPGGRTAHNRLVAREMGVVVARLDETIRKPD